MATSSRLRIRTHPPLGPFQAWIPFNPEQSIHSLKLAIVKLLQPSSNPLSPEDIVLELDAFAFLDQSPCSLIDPLHDLIDVKVAASSNAPSTFAKRPAPTDAKGSPRHSGESSTPHTSQQPIQAPLEDSNPSTTKLQQHEPDRPIKPLPASKSNVQPAAQPVRKPPAPPGQGKPSTKARNQRKRLQRMHNQGLRKTQSTTPTQKHAEPKPPQTTNSSSENPTLVAKNQALVPPRVPHDASKSSENKQCSRNHSQNNCENQINPSSTSSSSNQSKSSAADSSSPSSASNSLSSRSKSSSQSESTLLSDSSLSSSDASLSKSSSSSSTSSSSSSSSSQSDSSSSKSDSSSSESKSGSSTSQSFSSTLSDEPTKNSQCFKGPTKIIVPIKHNPLLTMLSLSNKNKRKNVKRKSCPHPLVQPTKIIFESPGSTNHRVLSPCYVPPSPNDTPQLETFPELHQTNTNQAGEAEYNHQNLAHDEHVYGNVDDTFTSTRASLTHGPPPSVRDASLVPSNIVISSVNVLNPYWTPGQIGEKQTWFTLLNHGAGQQSSNNKRKRKNRKKGLKKRRRMAAKQQLLERHDHDSQASESDDDDNVEDEGEDESEILKDVEEAYQEFIKTGGHGRPTDPTNASIQNTNGANGVKELAHRDEGLKKRLQENWDQFNKIKDKSGVVGSSIAIRTWEISTESFTPELVIYYGKIIKSNEAKLCMKLDVGCIPKSERNQNRIQNDDNPFEEEEEEEEEEERSVDVKEAIRKSHRDALINHLWGHSSPDVRHWEWNNILDARQL